MPAPGSSFFVTKLLNPIKEFTIASQAKMSNTMFPCLVLCGHDLLKKTFFMVTASLLILSLQACSSKYRIESPRYAPYPGEMNQHGRIIAAPPGKIFRLLTQEEAFGQICPEGTIVTAETSPPYGVGTRLRTRVEHIFKLGWTTQVEEVIPDEKIRLRFLDGFFVGGAEIWELEPRGDQTRVSQTIIVQPKGILRKMAWLMKVRRKHDRMVEIFLDNLKRVAESH
jgi:uncharacterized protein YndB with AHSA1/START domain